MRPRMYIVAGPPGSGKSSAFPVSGFGVDFFNADDARRNSIGDRTRAFRRPSAVRSTGNSSHS
jgi:predicted ABC-type ATPase